MFKRTKKNIIKNWAEDEDDLSNGFSNRIGDIFQKLTEKDATPKKEIDPMQRYRIIHPELVNKKLLNKILSYVNNLIKYKEYNNGWTDPRARKKALCNEKKLILEMLSTNWILKIWWMK